MTTNVIGLAVDSFLACLAIAPLLPATRDRAVLAALLGAADAVATLAVSRGSIATYFAVGLIAIVTLGIATTRPTRPALFALPLLLSIDNLLTPLAPNDAFAAGIASAGMATAGFVASTSVLRLVPPRLHAAVAIAFGSLAAIACIRG